MVKRKAPEAQAEPLPKDVDTIENEIEKIPHVEHDPRFNVFESLPLSADIQRRATSVFPPVTNTGSTFVIEMPPSNAYSDVNNARLVTQVKVLARAGNVAGIADDAAWGIINDIGNSLWKTIKVDMNGQTITNTSEAGAIAQYMCSLVFEDTSSIEIRKQNGFYLDTPYQIDTVADDSNKGNYSRRALFQNPADAWPRTGATDGARAFTGVATIITPLADRVDFCNNPAFLIPGVKLTLTLNKENDAKLMMGDNASTWVIQIQTVRLEIEHFEAVPSKMQDITNVLFSNNKATTYNMISKVPRQYIVQAGRKEWEMWNVIENNVPDFLLLGMTTTTSQQGQRDQSPYNFQTFNLSSAYLKKGTEEILPRVYFNHQGDYAEGVEMLHKALGVKASSNNKIINREKFRGGYAIFVWNLNPDGKYQPWKEVSGNNTGAQGVYIHLQFAQNLGANTTITIVGLFENKLMIDGGRNVVLETQF